MPADWPVAPRAVVFDCDGVLVDSEPLHARATTEHLASLGTPLDPEIFDRLVGMRVRDQMVVVAELGGHDPQAVFEGREAVFWTLLRQEFPFMADAAQSMRRMHATGLLIGVASSATRDYLAHVLDTLEVSPLVSAVTTGEHVQHPKPDPECYLRTAAALGIPPELCVAIEDSETGARSAAAAGMQVLGLDVAGLGGPPSARRSFRDLPSLTDAVLEQLDGNSVAGKTAPGRELRSGS